MSLTRGEVVGVGRLQPVEHEDHGEHRREPAPQIAGGGVGAERRAGSARARAAPRSGRRRAGRTAGTQQVRGRRRRDRAGCGRAAPRSTRPAASAAGARISQTRTARPTTAATAARSDLRRAVAEVDDPVVVPVVGDDEDRRQHERRGEQAEASRGSPVAPRGHAAASAQLAGRFRSRAASSPSALSARPRIAGDRGRRCRPGFDRDRARRNDVAVCRAEDDADRRRCRAAPSPPSPYARPS